MTKLKRAQPAAAKATGNKRYAGFGLTVWEIGGQHKIPYSTAFHLPETMWDCGYALGRLRSLVLPVIEELSKLTGLIVRPNTWAGKRHSQRCTGVGKALPMYMPRNAVKAPLEDLKRSAERGYSIDDAEDESEGGAVAAPIMGASGRILASIGFAGTLSQITIDKLDPLGRRVRRSADRISRRLGYPIPESAIIEVAA